MPTNVIGSTSRNNENKIDASFFVQKPYLKTNNIEGLIDENNNMKQYRNKNSPSPFSIREAASNFYVDNKFNDPSIKNNTTQLTSLIKI